MGNEYGKLMARVYDPALSPFIKGLRRRVAMEARRLGARSVIDLCCGTGDQLRYFSDRDFDHIVGVDLSPAMLEISKKYGVSCQQGDATKTDFEDNSFDLAMVSFALHEKPWDMARAIVDEAKRIVRPGGHLLVVDYYYDQKTKMWGRMMTWFIEFMVGGEHFRNYRTFIRKGGLDKLCYDLPRKKEIRLFAGSVTLSIYEIKK